MPNNDRRLIEDLIPIREISAEASREKSLRHGNLSPAPSSKTGRCLRGNESAAKSGWSHRIDANCHCRYRQTRPALHSKQNTQPGSRTNDRGKQRSGVRGTGRGITPDEK